MYVCDIIDWAIGKKQECLQVCLTVCITHWVIPKCIVKIVSQRVNPINNKITLTVSQSQWLMFLLLVFSEEDTGKYWLNGESCIPIRKIGLFHSQVVRYTVQWTFWLRVGLVLPPGVAAYRAAHPTITALFITIMTGETAHPTITVHSAHPHRAPAAPYTVLVDSLFLYSYFEIKARYFEVEPSVYSV